MSVARAGPPQERARHLLVPGPGYGRWSGLPGADALLDLVAEGLVHVLPVLEGPLQHRLGHAVEQLADDVGYQPVAGRVVQDVTDHRAGLAPVVVVAARGVGSADHVAVEVPRRLGGEARV